MCGLEHTPTGLPVEARSDGGKRVQVSLLPRSVFECAGAHVSNRIQMAAANFQADKANCYSYA